MRRARRTVRPPPALLRQHQVPGIVEREEGVVGQLPDVAVGVAASRRSPWMRNRPRATGRWMVFERSIYGWKRGSIRARSFTGWRWSASGPCANSPGAGPRSKTYSSRLRMRNNGHSMSTSSNFAVILNEVRSTRSKDLSPGTRLAPLCAPGQRLQARGYHACGVLRLRCAPLRMTEA